MQNFIDGVLVAIGLHKGALATGFIGSVLSFRFVNQLGTFGRAATFFGGALLAGFLAPLMVDWFGLKENYIGGVGFVVGALGMSVLAATLQAIKNADVISLVKGRFGGRA